MNAVALRYAEALTDAAEERNLLDEVLSDVEALADLLAESEDLRAFVEDPLVLPEQKRGAMSSLFAGKVNEVTLNFLLLLCEKRRERILGEMLDDFVAIVDERRGIVTAEVRSAAALTEAQKDRLTSKLSSFSGRQVRLETEVDPSLKAGFIARIGDQVFDGTLNSMLNRLHQELKSGT